MPLTPPSTPCPCGRLSPRGKPLALADCCGPYLDGGQSVPDAEALMRSRYSAFVLGRADWLLRTWHPDTRPATLELDPAERWLGLQVRRHRVIDERRAEVEFVARSRTGPGPARRLHEASRFERDPVLGWLYRDGDADAGFSSAT